MENAPDIILFWYFGIAIFILMIALMIVTFIFMKKGKRQNAKKIHLLGKICLALVMICSIPIICVVRYILYLYLM